MDKKRDFEAQIISSLNLGESFERLGKMQLAIENYCQALELIELRTQINNQTAPVQG
jgi:hypothetical protein